MPDIDVWPPKPNLPDPLTEHDNMIAAKLAEMSAEEPTQMRFRLIKAMREEGLEMRQAIAVVKSYCNRQEVLVSRTPQVFAWSNFSLVLVAMVLNLLNLYLSYQRDVILGMPHTHAAFLAFRRDQLAISYAVTLLLSLNAILLVIRFRRNRKIRQSSGR